MYHFACMAVRWCIWSGAFGPPRSSSWLRGRLLGDALVYLERCGWAASLQFMAA